MLAGEFKQEILKLHNHVNLGLFGQGLRWQKVEILEDKMIIQANNKRVKALTAIDSIEPMTTKLMDLSLLLEFKTRFRRQLKEELGLDTVCVLKDYDPASELSVCIIVLKERVEDFLESLNR